MRSYLVVGFSEAFEHSLLDAEVGTRRVGGPCLGCSMHAFVSAVLLWITGRDALMSDSELEPPDVQASQPMNACGSKRSAVVASDGVRKAVFTE